MWASPDGQKAGRSGPGRCAAAPNAGLPGAHTVRAAVYAAVSALVLALSLSFVGVARAAAPVATTTPATNLTATSATLNGIVDPSGEETTYVFNYGAGDQLTVTTPVQTVPGTNQPKDVSVDITGLTPDTLYVYRVYATNMSSEAPGNILSFRTPAATPPPGPGPGPNANTISIAANPTAITFGRSSTISGKVNGQGAGGVAVTLQQSTAPFTGGFKDLATGTTDANGSSSFVVKPGANTRYRVVAKASPTITSAEVLVLVRVRVTLGVSDRTPFRGQRIRFSGTVTPAHNGKVARIQRRTSTGSYRTVAKATLVATTPANGVARSKFSKRLRLFRSGTYRVRVVTADGDHAAGTSPRRRLTVG